MQIDLTSAGARLVGAGGRVELGPARPSATVRVGGRERRWAPSRLTVDSGTGALTASGGPGGVALELCVAYAEDDAGGVEVTATLRNDGHVPVEVERLGVLHATELRVGEQPRRWRTYRNGYQSWAGTRTMGVADADADLPTRLVRLGVTDARHASPTRRGHVRSDSLSAVCEPVSGDALGIGFTTLADSFGFVELVAPAGRLDRLDVWSDQDGVALAPGTSVSSTVRVVATHGAGAGESALRAVAEAGALAMGARGRDRSHPAGWCSWYYYFTKVTEADVLENLAVLAEDGRDGPVFGCEYVMVDDGHQSAIGDWLLTDGASFPSGMADLATRIRDVGFDAGIWWAPFLVDPNSRIATEHPDWLVRNDKGRPIVGCLNPNWSLRHPMRVLDTTHPEVIEHLTHVARSIGGWGYAIQKLDFLYAAALPGTRHDPTVTRAASLRRGLDAIRAGAGDDGFLLGCGCPLGPAVGAVDAMRIGADVTPYWSNAIDRVGGRGLHGLATRNAVGNTATRAVLDGVWWLNDPDCLMVRDTDTKLSEDEVRVLATAIGMTNGMIVLSDRMSRLGADRRAMVGVTRELAGGRVEVSDLFEQGLPELLISRHGSHVDVGVFNLDDCDRRVTVDLLRRGVELADGPVAEVWTGRQVDVAGGIADLGVLPAHSVRVLRIPNGG